MMLAYRRGLLEPDYKYGLQSIIRENMILEMLDCEQAAEAIKLASLVRSASLAPAIRPESAVEFTESFSSQLTRSVYLSEYNKTLPVSNTSEKKLESESGSLLKAFNLLKERGIIEEFRRRADEAFQALQEDLQ